MSRRSKSRPAPPVGQTDQPQVANPDPPATDSRTDLLWLARLQLTLALGISSYLAYTSLTSGAVSGCGPGSDCGPVLASRWAYWFNLPVSVPAVVFYVLLLIASFLASPVRPAAVQRAVWMGLIAGAFVVLGAGLWFVGLQGAILGSWCPWCMGAHFLGSIGAVLILVAAPHQIRSPGAVNVPFGVLQRVWPAALGIAGLVPLVAGQIVSQPPEASVTSLGGEPSVPAPQSRVFPVHQGRFPIDLYEAPLIGRPGAPTVIVSLFDYTCSHCRRQHAMLKRVQKIFADELAVVLVPMPLDSNCNPLLNTTGADHVNACEYARIGMAVWRARPEVFADYEDWFFEPEKPRPLGEVLARAIDLTGRPDLQEVAREPWIDAYLKTGVGIFTENWQRTGRNILPMLMVGTALSSGKIDSDSELLRILEDNVGLKRSAPASGTNGPAQ